MQKATNEEVISLPQEIHNFYNSLTSETEDSLLELVKKIIDQYGNKVKELFNYVNNNVGVFSFFWREDNDIEIKSPPLYFITIKQYARLAELFLDIGASTELGISSNQLHWDNRTPLIAACLNGNLQLVKMLVEHGANLLAVSTSGNHPLMWEKISPEIFAFLLEEGKRQNKLEKLLSLKSKASSAFVIEREDPFYANLLMNIGFYPNPIAQRRFLHINRISVWGYPKKRAEFEFICQKLRSKTQKLPNLDYRKDFRHQTNYLAGIELFADDFFHMPGKEAATKVALSQIKSLLNSPERCVKYLNFLTLEFERYYYETHQQKFPVLDSDSYEFISLDGLYFPIPKNNFLGIKKSSALQEFLILLLQKHGVGHNALKWIGFIPTEIANPIVKEGDFFIENRLGFGLFHNSYSHMIQLAIILYAIEDYVIKLIHFGISITIKDILEALVTLTSKDGSSPWTVNMDQRQAQFVTFTDPHRLASFIMDKGKELGMKSLSDYLIDNFCKGFQQLFAAFQVLYLSSEKLSYENFIEQLGDLSLEFAEDPNGLIKYATEIERKKNRSINHSGDYYAVVSKNYHPNNKFIPKEYEDDEIGSVNDRLRKKFFR